MANGRHFEMVKATCLNENLSNFDEFGADA